MPRPAALLAALARKSPARKTMGPKQTGPKHKKQAGWQNHPAVFLSAGQQRGQGAGCQLAAAQGFVQGVAVAAHLD